MRLHDGALSAGHPLRTLWSLNSNLPEGKRMTEYVALAQIYPALREEMRTTGESFRRSQIDAMERVYADRGLDRSRIGLPGLMLLMSPLARSFVIEREARVTLAHAEVEDLIIRLLDRFDPLGEVDAAPEPLQQRS